MRQRLQHLPGSALVQSMAMIDKQGVPSPPMDTEQHKRLTAWSQQHRRALLRFFQRRMPTGADQEDLVQDVFVRLARHEDLSNIEHVDRYLFHAAANVLKDWRRKQITHAAAAHDPLGDDLQDVGFSPERVLVGRDSLKALIGALETLPDRTRAIFMLYHFEQLAHAEIGRRLGVAVRTVEDHIGRANRHLMASVRDKEA